MSVKTFGDFCREHRIAAGMTLRGFCEKSGFDVGNVSKWERGQLPPPQSEDSLRRYALALQLQEGSDTWQEFLDLAAAGSGLLPSDLRSNEDVLAKMPLIFRTLRREQPTDEQLKELFDALKEA